ncbi:hypothetical protein BKA70DRAFT_1417138 [Coprinopsis sp. MPI-PUGE-AT-0042]|nr:hypothetical protein BKA70DRAFT_1417138 [Coprinopsis sp. MPI-PUGE-AT-0042]
MPGTDEIEDKTGTNLVDFRRRTIHLTIMNAVNYADTVHKLLKIGMVDMIIKCFSRERGKVKY